ncbi:hypothetical protein MIN45_P1030 [Methylomarinovum tepidoasis]|uniref:Lipoprotein n=1 Tax=Methylomarinovum tepidoasis TaxID=2840183 RepID=A0AAU9C9V1_9GAMM|nr:Lpp/OprI family alanine-zipper lipoprotein [Methylomarinovum sp. IN45]BCX88661.1 hypothetical protein MIN45_P1030 [Methylomarinovum sp. IN45]
MKTFARFFVVAGAVVLMSGCASQVSREEMDHMHHSIHELEAKLAQTDALAHKALSEATTAHEHASEAEELAKECKQMCAAHGAHMEKMFQKSMMK